MKSLAQLRAEMWIDRINELLGPRKLSLKKNEEGEYCLLAETECSIGVVYRHKSLNRIEDFVSGLYSWELRK